MAPPHRSTQLSEREREVLFLAGDGLTDKEIAAHLAIRTKTVRTYWDRIRAKLNAASRTQALALSLKVIYDELAERELRLRALVDTMPVAFFAFDDDLRIVASNAEGRELTGYTLEEIEGTRAVFAKVIPEEVRRTHIVREWLTRGGEFRNWEIPIVRKDGTRRIVSWSSGSEKNRLPGWRTWIVGVDVTSLREREQTLRFLVDSVDEGIWLLKSDFHTDVVNRRMEEILGVEANALAGATPTEYIADEDMAEAKQVLSEGGRERFAFRFRTAQGELCEVVKSLRPVRDSSGAVNGFLVLATESRAKPST
jgi:PAS domain S-box-containing protein